MPGPKNKVVEVGGTLSVASVLLFGWTRRNVSLHGRHRQPTIQVGRNAGILQRGWLFLTASVLLGWCTCTAAVAAGNDHDHLSGLWSDLVGILALQTYNTRLVVLSTSCLGLAAGVSGGLLLLRKRSLMGDALSHACLPGIALVFIWGVTTGLANPKSLPLLLAGGAATGILGISMVLMIRASTRIKDDAAMGIVLSVFFGLGVVLLGMIQTMPQASAAGLESFIYGKAASMVRSDAVLICSAALAVTLLVAILFKEFALVCFDADYAGSQGWPVLWLDILMLGMVTAVTVVGLQSVGLILIIAFLITPAAAARFWTNSLRRMLLLAGLIGALSGWAGSSLSALLPRLPAGAVIVLVAAAIFLVSMLCGRARGVFPRWVAHRSLQQKIGQQHLLRAAYEQLESRLAHHKEPVTSQSISFPALLKQRSWTRVQLNQLVRKARQQGLVSWFEDQQLLLSPAGFNAAAWTTRNHRLWEMYLIKFADIAPSHVDRDADRVEDVLTPELVDQLEDELIRRGRTLVVPPSPHPLKLRETGP